MFTQSCNLDTDCPSFYHCQQGICKHDQIFPLSVFTIIIYVATGLFAAICNVSGNSMGIFKILILIVLLNYNLDEATGLAQALVVGTALPNFIQIILKKHPNGKTSLVHFKLLQVIIPCCLLGSTVGALGQTLIPKVGQLSLLVLVFSFFAINFIKKLRNLKRNDNHLQHHLTTEEQKQLHQIQHQPQREELLKYQKSYHSVDIIHSIGLFIVFQFLAFLVQGKLPFYSIDKCSLNYPLGILLLFVITLVYLFYLRIRLIKVYKQYRKYYIQQEIQMDDISTFFMVVSGAFMAGMIQGILGMGCGTCIMLVLLSFPLNSTVATATSGYQILFTGLGSLIEYYINGQVQLFECLWFMGICFVIGGISTYGLYNLLKRMNQFHVNRFLYVVILCLCMMSIFLTIPTVKNIVDQDGWEGLLKIQFNCN